MPHVLTCRIAPGAMPALKALRADHLEYIRDHLPAILFGGPARAPDGAPETMIIVLRTDDPASAESFIAAEPYNASGRVFAEVSIRRWSQVVPEAAAGDIERAIEQERA